MFNVLHLSCSYRLIDIKAPRVDCYHWAFVLAQTRGLVSCQSIYRGCCSCLTGVRASRKPFCFTQLLLALIFVFFATRCEKTEELLFSFDLWFWHAKTLASQPFGQTRTKVVRANGERSNLIGWRQTLTSPPANYIRVLLVRAKKSPNEKQAWHWPR